MDDIEIWPSVTSKLEKMPKTKMKGTARIIYTVLAWSEPSAAFVCYMKIGEVSVKV
jgi:hypothetical protein